MSGSGVTKLLSAHRLPVWVIVESFPAGGGALVQAEPEGQRASTGTGGVPGGGVGRGQGEYLLEEIVADALRWRRWLVRHGEGGAGKEVE